MATVAPSAAEPEGGRTSLGKVWLLLRLTGEGFIEDDAWSRGASIAYFTLFSVAPTLLVVIAVAGLTFGQEAAQGAIVSQLSGLMGRETAEALQAMISSASDSMSGTWATVIGVVAILLATTGVFGEVQSSLNAVWKAESRRSALSRLVRARIASLGLVIAFGFVLMVSLAVSAALTALMTFLHGIFPVLEVGLAVVDFAVVDRADLGPVRGHVQGAARHADRLARRRRRRGLRHPAVCRRQVPDRALYRQSNIASSFGAAGALIVLLLWIFYSAQIFLLGAEFTRAWACVFGSRCPAKGR